MKRDDYPVFTTYAPSGEAPADTDRSWTWMLIVAATMLALGAGFAWVLV